MDSTENTRKQRKLLELLDRMEKEPVWKDEDHPEIVRLGTAEYIRQMRHTQSERQKNIDRKLAELYES